MSQAPEAGQQGGQRATDAVPPPYEDADENPIRVLAIVNTLLRYRWIIVVIAGTITAITIVYTLLVSPVFTAKAQFLPSQSPAMSSRMGAIIEGGANVGRGDDPTTDYYVALVQSPTFLQSIVTRDFTDSDGEVKSLVAIYKPSGGSDQERARRAAERLGEAVSISAARAVGNQPRLITLECNAKSATLAADICSAVIDEIVRHNSEVRGAKARQNREFVEAQLATAKKELDAATEAFATFTARNRKIVSPALEAERDRLERQVRVKDDVYNTLSRQLVLARIEEQETRPTLEMIQTPEPPLMRSAPARTRTVITAGFVGLFLGCAAALGWGFVRRFDSTDPDGAEFRRNLNGIKCDLLRLVGRGRRAPVA